ncbi:MAG: citrate synthase [Planctomycetota bacterium]|nr:MAG: citrate synthase [Planctomycetota bacterium]RLS92312.1 MAG: citrate synthase [Planctomycetota bacterium]
MSTTPATPAAPIFDKGLGNTIAATTQMSFIDGGKGVLEYVGIDIDSLARYSTYEETVFLLWNTKLPDAAQLRALSSALQSEYEIPDAIYDMIRSFPTTAVPMHALRTLVSALGLHDVEADADGIEASKRKALRLVAKTPTLIANFDRHRSGKAFVRPNPSFDIATNFLWMLNGEKPTAAMARGLDVCLILHADHGLNASTFAARVTIATLSDLYSAMTTAVGTLKGPLHGGANEEVMIMLDEIGSMEKVEAFVQDKLERKELIMGFGHRVYKAYDPRATYLKTFAKQIATDTGNLKLFEMSQKIEEIVIAAKADKGIFPNVDFYSATTYHCLGIKTDLFTCMFAMSRMSGWCGHCIEQLEDNRLIRPQAKYTGPHGAAYVELSKR